MEKVHTVLVESLPTIYESDDQRQGGQKKKVVVKRQSKVDTKAYIVSIWSRFISKVKKRETVSWEVRRPPEDLVGVSTYIFHSRG